MDAFGKMKKQAEEGYKQIKFVRCPYFGEDVNFNAKGLDHIKFKTWNRTRIQSDQEMRLKYLHLAPKVVSQSHTLQGVSTAKSFERKKINNRWEKILTDVTYFEFIAVIENVRVRVIIKEVKGGQKYFWSIIPFWKVNKQQKKRVLISRNPECD